jgi:hypothetical protein
MACDVTEFARQLSVMLAVHSLDFPSRFLPWLISSGTGTFRQARNSSQSAKRTVARTAPFIGISVSSGAKSEKV